MRQWLLGFACFIFSSLPALADDWLKALLLFDAGRYEESISLLTPLAATGHIEAQEILYAAYSHGYGVAVDHEKALHWLELSVAQGAASAQDAMARHFLEGRGVARDEAKAVHWFRLAAQQGHAPAMYELAMMTLEGRGTAPDPEEGWRLLKWAAERESADALYVVGVNFLASATDDAEFDLALEQLRHASRLGQRNAHALLGVIYEDLPEDPHHRVKAAFHYQMAADAGCVDVGAAAATAAARLSQAEVETLQYNLDKWTPGSDPRDPQPVAEACLSG